MKMNYQPGDIFTNPDDEDENPNLYMLVNTLRKDAGGHTLYRCYGIFTGWPWNEESWIPDLATEGLEFKYSREVWDRKMRLFANTGYNEKSVKILALMKEVLRKK